MRNLILIIIALFMSGCVTMNKESSLIFPGDTYTFTEKGMYITEGRMYDICKGLWEFNIIASERKEQ